MHCTTLTINSNVHIVTCTCTMCHIDTFMVLFLRVHVFHVLLAIYMLYCLGLFIVVYNLLCLCQYVCCKLSLLISCSRLRLFVVVYKLVI